MTYHVFFDRGLMLSETAAQDIASDPLVRLVPFSHSKRPGSASRAYQALHILARPFSLRASAYFARKFNSTLQVSMPELQAASRAVGAGDVVLWLNPSLATASVVSDLQSRGINLNLYFLDPVHRLGIGPREILAWQLSARTFNYSEREAERFGMHFLVPYAPVVAPSDAPPSFALVYVGSPSPGRLLWILILNLHLWARGKRGYLRLAVRRASLVRRLPGLFCHRMAFSDYIELCRRSRGILELHERDAGGVTLRATLCGALQCTHVCNLPTTPDTVHISRLRWGALDSFLTTGDPSIPKFSRMAIEPFNQWLRRHFETRRSGNSAHTGPLPTGLELRHEDGSEASVAERR